MLAVDMSSARKIFNEVIDCVNKVEGVRQDGQAKVFAKRTKNC